MRFYCRILFVCAFALSCSAAHASSNYKIIEGHGRHKGKKFHTGLRQRPKALKNLGVMHVTLDGCDNLPDSFDLRDLGVVPPTRDQGQCGSCWAFSKTGALESAVAAAGGNILDLSEQQLVSCDTAQYGCGGGLLDNFNYQLKNGQALESDFPYTASDNSCRQGLKPAAKPISFALVGQAGRRPTEQEVKCALYKSHSIPWITVSATSAWGNPPSSYKTPYTSCSNGETNHAVGVIGWYPGPNGQTQFIMRNSWSDQWGDGGFMSLPLGCDNFGEEVAYVIAGNIPCKPPIVKLPTTITSAAGVQVVIGVSAQDGVDYVWYLGANVVGKGPLLYITPAADTIYRLVGKNNCGTSESSIQIKIMVAPTL